jgi:hypothetical protein
MYHLLLIYTFKSISPNTFYRIFFSSFFPISPRCLLQTSTTSGSKLKPIYKIKIFRYTFSCNTTISTTNNCSSFIILFKLRPAPTKVELYKCSSVEATCISPSINNDFPNCSNSKISMCCPTFDLKSSRTSLTTYDFCNPGEL